MVGGSFEVKSRPMQGTQIAVRVPIKTARVSIQAQPSRRVCSGRGDRPRLEYK
jgi:hypothetical protein